MPLGFLAVLTHPSSQLTLEDFHAWYEEEHIPIRMDRLKEFLSGARYRAADHDIPSTGPLNIDNAEGKGSGDLDISRLPVEKPEWLAMYEIDDTETFDKPVYTDLRKMRSARETDVMRRLEVVERRVGRVVWDSDMDASDAASEVLGSGGGARHTGLLVANPCQWIVTASLQLKTRPYDRSVGDGELKDWAEGFAREQLGGAGVERVRVIDVFDWGCTSMGPAVSGLVGPRWFVIFGAYFFFELAWK
ncbi:hypothetical protein CVT24_001000 [Panaeolus cyanescens]|uniref:EthD domain-containing protein n=1 Tax=Panaeolus cyanescens TaxID=181874 RepID=A0A409YCH2_9AGAR|nr:hypothetical protein CVT24_001000 [Panaeolus cyanescens]